MRYLSLVSLALLGLTGCVVATPAPAPATTTYVTPPTTTYVTPGVPATSTTTVVRTP